MPTPFPGMDPWLEAPDVWPGLHISLVCGAVSQLQPQLRSCGYFANANERRWIHRAACEANPNFVLVQRPSPRATTTSGAAILSADEPVRVRVWETEFWEPFLEVYETKSRRLVTTVEFLSPANKGSSKARRLFEQQRRERRRAGVNRVEIDLLRAGGYLLVVPEGLASSLKPWDYFVCLRRPKQPDYEIYPIRLRNRLPRIHVPLKAGGADAVLDLQALLTSAYDTGPYPDRLDYSAAAEPPLNEEDAAWADELLRQAGYRDPAASRTR
jgi:hypothetical protein